MTEGEENEQHPAAAEEEEEEVVAVSTPPNRLPAHYSGLVDEWYCVMAVCGAPPTDTPRSAKRSSTNGHTGEQQQLEEDGDIQSSQPQRPRGSQATRRTAVYHTTDPIGYICKLNGDPLLPFGADAVEWYAEQERQISGGTTPSVAATPPTTGSSSSLRKRVARGGSSRFRIVFVIGPVPRQKSAQIVQTLLLWRSRGLVPRTAWGKLIAEHFFTHFWVNYEEVFPMRHHVVLHNPETGDVFLRSKAALDSEANEEYHDQQHQQKKQRME